MFVFLIAVSCGNKNPSPVVANPDFLSTKAAAYEQKLGVFQTVVYNFGWNNVGKYYLDTWSCTNKDQWHNHAVWAADGDGTYGSGSGNNDAYPYDSVASGSFEYIKSIKAAEYKRAKTVYDYEIKIGIEKRRIEDSVKLAFKNRIDSVKMLNDLKP